MPTIVVTSNYTVAADELALNADPGPVFQLTGGGVPILTFLNLGVVRSTASNAIGVTSGAGPILDNRNLIEALGTLSAVGVDISGVILRNTGTIRAAATVGPAIGLQGSSGENAGSIIARAGATGAAAMGMYFANGGAATNNGSLLAIALASDLASAAIGIRNNRMDLSTITNNGSIVAADMNGESATHTYGIYVDGVPQTSQTPNPTIVNHGTITARWAIVSAPLSGADLFDHVLNDGTLNGEIRLNAGNDRLQNSGAINGAVSMGAGDDRLTNTGTISGAITLDEGADVFIGGASSEVVNGGSGADEIDGGDGIDLLRGDADSDILRGGGGDDDLEGGSGMDKLFGSEGRDDLDGGNGEDELDGGVGLDVLRGGAGDDIFHLRDDVEAIMDGGAGVDTLRLYLATTDFRSGSVTAVERMEFIRPNASVATMNAQFNGTQISFGFFSPTFVLSGSAAQDSVQIFVEAGGTISTAGWSFDFPSWGFDDYIVYTGNTGAENFTGFAGLDIFFAGGGNDVMNGGGATDFAAYIFSPDAVTADLTTVGAQFISASQGSDTFNSIEGLAGSQLADTLRGNDEDNFLLGLHGNDTLTGRGGTDDIRGGEHSDRIEGGLGADILWGAMDPAVMSGPDGSDTFVYRNTNEGGDTIRDFQAGVDRIEVSAAGFGLAAGATAVLVSGGDPVATGAGGQFLYDTDDGRFFFDADGAGVVAAVIIATLTTRPALTATDIVVTSIASAGSGADLESAIMPVETPELAVLGPDALPLG